MLSHFILHLKCFIRSIDTFFIKYKSISSIVGGKWNGMTMHWHYCLVVHPFLKLGSVTFEQKTGNFNIDLPSFPDSIHKVQSIIASSPSRLSDKTSKFTFHCHLYWTDLYLNSWHTMLFKHVALDTKMEWKTTQSNYNTFFPETCWHNSTINYAINIYRLLSSISEE